MVTSSAARSRTGSSSVATSRAGSRRAKSQSAVDDSAQHSPIILASESSDANRNVDCDVEMLDQEEALEKRWFKEVLIHEPDGFDRKDYEFLDSIVHKVLEEEVDENGLAYRVRFRDRHEETVSTPICLHLLITGRPLSTLAVMTRSSGYLIMSLLYFVTYPSPPSPLHPNVT